MSVCSSHCYPHWSPCGGALRLFRTWVAHHPLTSSIFALLIQLTPRAAHETRKNCSLFVTIRAGTLVLTWEPLALWRWPVKVILSRKTARWNTPGWWSAVWELHRLGCSRCSAFIFPGNLADFFFSYLLQGVRVCWVWDKERRGGCSTAWWPCMSP